MVLLGVGQVVDLLDNDRVANLVVPHRTWGSATTVPTTIHVVTPLGGGTRPPACAPSGALGREDAQHAHHRGELFRERTERRSARAGVAVKASDMNPNVCVHELRREVV